MSVKQCSTVPPWNTSSCLSLQLLRGGQIIEAEFVCSPNDMLVPVHTYDRLPTYFIYAGKKSVQQDGVLVTATLPAEVVPLGPGCHAGLVFIPLTQPYLMVSFGTAI
jgi:hypothetical protein